MSTTSKVMYSVRGFFGVPNDMGRVMTLTGSIIFPLKLYKSFVGSLSYFLVVTHLFKGCEEEDFGLLPLSMRILVTSHLSMWTVTTMPSV
jgi:hypothetical protein